MGARKKMVVRVALVVAVLGLTPFGCEEAEEEDAPKGGQHVVNCNPEPFGCPDEGCVGAWKQSCMVEGDVCVVIPEAVGQVDPSVCFKGECLCEEGCFWDGMQCIAYTGCPDVPPPTEPTKPYPYEGCDGCPNQSWQPEDGITLKWSEPADLFVPYEIEVKRNPYLYRECAGEPDWVSERLRMTTYDIYFGTEPDPPLLFAAVPTSEQELPDHVMVHDAMPLWETPEGWFQPAEFHVPGPLAAQTQYFWRVVVRNRDGLTASGPIWQFTSVGPGVDTTCPGMPTVLDDEGNSYDTAQIGDQCWTKQPLRLGQLCTGSYTCQQDNGTIEKSCQNSGADCNGYYTWNELMRWSAPGSICPAGWHVPSLNEWNQLIAHPDASRLSPSYGGYIEYSNVSGGEGATAYIWSSDEIAGGVEGTAHVVLIAHPSQSKPPDTQSFNKGYRMTAHCLRD